MVEKLTKSQPETIGSASQIEGVTPAAINLILDKHKKTRAGKTQCMKKTKLKQKKKLEKFVNEALAFNKKHNIFVRESIKEVYEKDVDDCLPVLQKINNSDKILDLGSGGGFPGIIIAILNRCAKFIF